MKLLLGAFFILISFSSFSAISTENKDDVVVVVVEQNDSAACGDLLKELGNKLIEARKVIISKDPYCFYRDNTSKGSIRYLKY